jgi:hypothetical protein
VKAAIARGKLRAPCATCDREIARGELRVAEPCNDGRIPNAKLQFHHLECAIEHHPRLVRAIVIATPSSVPDPTALNARLQILIERLDAAPVAPVTAPAPRDANPTIDTLLGQLENDPTDRAVLADALGQQGDPRGELIALDLSLEREPADGDARTKRRTELRRELSPRLFRHDGVPAEWGIGFIRAVTVWSRDLERTYLNLWKHPSLRVLSELDASQYLPDTVPSTLRTLRLRSILFADKLAPRALATLARLVKLELENVEPFELAHPTLARLELGANDMPALDLAALPALVDIAFGPLQWYAPDERMSPPAVPVVGRSRCSQRAAGSGASRGSRSAAACSTTRASRCSASPSPAACSIASTCRGRSSRQSSSPRCARCVASSSCRARERRSVAGSATRGGASARSCGCPAAGSRSNSPTACARSPTARRRWS